MEIAPLLDEFALQRIGGPRDLFLACFRQTGGGQQYAQQFHNGSLDRG
jgi:hypothetical protein